ncbi:DUF397 domain-containing protein [Streptomyces sp. NPDC016845]|uniref:DUF397 domain-containing protein n=1 Tax=Streptomyces sp. NPDC016845 TaxID=3364972 RepID=UPI0037BACD15
MKELSIWQKSSYCGEGEACLHVATTAAHIHVTESADPSGAILTATPAAFFALLSVMKGNAPTATDDLQVKYGIIRAEAATSRGSLAYVEKLLGEP